MFVESAERLSPSMSRFNGEGVRWVRDRNAWGIRRTRGTLASSTMAVVMRNVAERGALSASNTSDGGGSKDRLLPTHTRNPQPKLNQKPSSFSTHPPLPFPFFPLATLTQKAAVVAQRQPQPPSPGGWNLHHTQGPHKEVAPVPSSRECFVPS